MTVKEAKERQEQLQKIITRLGELYKKADECGIIGSLHTGDMGVIYSLIRTEIERINRAKIDYGD